MPPWYEVSRTAPEGWVNALSKNPRSHSAVTEEDTSDVGTCMLPVQIEPSSYVFQYGALTSWVSLAGRSFLGNARTERCVSVATNTRAGCGNILPDSAFASWSVADWKNIGRTAAGHHQATSASVRQRILLGSTSISRATLCFKS